ncbi:unnamed protein product [Pieris brassicae]|uniref:PEHE domain-containing protein n=1 Tax=Pieris brassicae TaxID=7116 RepID=A0A9P0XL44_PIEBR|nr:unnamed protein product [Pieris brassicae]
MNSRNSVNKNNLMNFSTGLTTLNQLDPKDDLVRFPFDHIYACHSDPGRRTVLPIDKEVEQASRLVVAEKEDKYFNLNKIHEHLNALELKNKRLKDLLIYHLELVQQQNEAITKKDKLYQVLKLENNALKAKLVGTFGLSIACDPHEMTYHPPEPTSTVTSETINQKSPQIVDLYPAVTSHRSPERKNDLKEIFERARISAQALIEKHNREIAVGANFTQLKTCASQMIENKRSRTKKANCKEPQSQAKPRQTMNRKASPKTNPMVQRKKRKSTSKSTRCRSKQQIETPQAVAVGKSYQSPAFKKAFKYKSTGSLAQCLRLIDTTPTGEDPYQLVEAEFEEVQENPILKRKTASHLFVNKNRKSAIEDIVSDSEECEVDILNVTPDMESKENLDYPIDPREPVLEQSFSIEELHDSLSQASRHMQIEQQPSTSRAKKRALSTTGVSKDTKKPRAKRVKRSPLPGFAVHEPFHTLIGDPECDWCVTLATGVNSELFDPDLALLNNVEVPQWRENKYEPDTHCVCAEFVNDKTYEKRHNKHETEERRQLRWHMRRIREQRHMERLRQRHKDSWSNMPVTPPSVYTLWPRPQRDLHELQIALSLPVGAFGEDIPDLPHANFMLPWVRTSKALKRSKRSKTLH